VNVADFWLRGVCLERDPKIQGKLEYIQSVERVPARKCTLERFMLFYHCHPLDYEISLYDCPFSNALREVLMKRQFFGYGTHWFNKQDFDVDKLEMGLLKVFSATEAPADLHILPDKREKWESFLFYPFVEAVIPAVYAFGLRFFSANKVLKAMSLWVQSEMGEKGDYQHNYQMGFFEQATYRESRWFAATSFEDQVARACFWLNKLPPLIVRSSPSESR
jgi:hypothetical protein